MKYSLVYSIRKAKKKKKLEELINMKYLRHMVAETIKLKYFFPIKHLVQFKFPLWRIEWELNVSLHGSCCHPHKLGFFFLFSRLLFYLVVFNPSQAQESVFTFSHLESIVRGNYNKEVYAVRLRGSNCSILKWIQKNWFGGVKESRWMEKHGEKWPSKEIWSWKEKRSLLDA